MGDAPKFIADCNVGKLARWLRLMGYDTRFFNGGSDSQLVTMAQAEGRVILSRDTRIMKRRVITSGRLKAILIQNDEPELQMRQVIDDLDLGSKFRPFTICVEDLVPPYVYQTQSQFMQCPACQRIYWRGTHWRAMTERLKKFVQA
jgi:uncharacterized protein with PIN domain